MSGMRHKRSFKLSRWNGRLASESCHWQEMAGPGGHNILTLWGIESLSALGRELRINRDRRQPPHERAGMPDP